MTPVQVKQSQAAVDWDLVHGRIQKILESLLPAIGSAIPDTTSKAGRTSTQVCPLFSFREFVRASDSDSREAIVAGVRFEPRADCFCVHADIGGEESGATVFEMQPGHVSSSAAAILAAAESAALELCRHVDLVITALRVR